MNIDSKCDDDQSSRGRNVDVVMMILQAILLIYLQMPQRRIALMTRLIPPAQVTLMVAMMLIEMLTRVILKLRTRIVQMLIR
nr:hypothetical protein Iba_chr09bCG12890 [Ipomoea batatas]